MSIINLIPMGITNKISSSDLAKRAGCRTVRELQQLIESERLAGAVICSTAENGGGYFRPETITELRAHVRTVDNRAKSTLKSNTAARRALQQAEQAKEQI